MDINVLRSEVDKFFKQEFGVSVDDSDWSVYIVGSIADDSYSSGSDVDVLVGDCPSTFEDEVKSLSLKIYENELEVSGDTWDLHFNVNLKQGAREGSGEYIEL